MMWIKKNISTSNLALLNDGIAPLIITVGCSTCFDLAVFYTDQIIQKECVSAAGIKPATCANHYTLVALVTFCT